MGRDIGVLSEWFKEWVCIVFVNVEDKNHLLLSCNNLQFAEIKG